MKRLWRDYGLSITLGLLFLVSFVGHTVSGYYEYAARRAGARVRTHNPRRRRVWLGVAEWTLQNWQSEFLELTTFVVLSSFLIHKGSPESQGRRRRDAGDARADREASRRAGAARTGRRTSRQPDPDRRSRPVRVSRWWPSASHQHDRSDGERQQHHRPGQPGLEAALFERLIIPVVPGRPSVIHRPMVAHAASRPRRVGRGATLQGAAVPGRCLERAGSALLARGEEHRDDRVLGQRRPPADQPRDAPDVAAGPCERLRVEARPEGSGTREQRLDRRMTRPPPTAVRRPGAHDEGSARCRAADARAAWPRRGAPRCGGMSGGVSRARARPQPPGGRCRPIGGGRPWARSGDPRQDTLRGFRLPEQRTGPLGPMEEHEAAFQAPDARIDRPVVTVGSLSSRSSIAVTSSSRRVARSSVRSIGKPSTRGCGVGVLPLTVSKSHPGRAITLAPCALQTHHNTG